MRTLVFNVNWLGDCLFSTPLLRALKIQDPKGHLACVIPPRCREVLVHNPDVDEMLFFDEKTTHRSWSQRHAFSQLLRAQRFDRAFLLHRSHSRAFLTWSARIPQRIGYRTKGRSVWLTHPVQPPREILHKAETFCRLAEASGVPVAKRQLFFRVTDDARGRAAATLKRQGIDIQQPYVVFQPSANWLPKRWPPSHFVALGLRLRARWNFPVVLAGTSEEAGWIADMARDIGTGSVSICGQTGFEELGAVFQSARLVVCNDSGPLHLAVAVEAPTLALFGPTDWRQTGPFGPGRYRIAHHDIGRPVDKPVDPLCQDYRYMEGLTVDQVYTEASHLLSA